MKQINLNEWVKSGEGFEADSFNNTKDDNIMLKLFFPNILKERIESSFNATNEYMKLGINTPKAYELVECDGRIGIIYEKIKNKISLYRMFVNDHSKDEEVGKTFATLLKDFHSHTITPNQGRSRIQILEYTTCGMLQKADFIDNDKKEILTKKSKEFYEKFGEEAKSPNLCMGDCHIGNIIFANNQYYFIDLSDLEYGSPLIDLAWIEGAYKNTNLIDDAVPQDERIPLENKIKFLNSFNNTYFAGQDKKSIEEQIEKTTKYQIIQTLLMHIYVTKNVSEIEKILS